MAKNQINSSWIKIRNDEKVFVGQDQVSKVITEFYRELYSSLKELQEALSSCKESWAWKHSLNTGNLPTTSHLESVIAMLPKEGKDTKDIKNWRPITLSNCDAKIITKSISLKTSKVLESIIDPSQTAYVPGMVAVNLRSNFF